MDAQLRYGTDHITLPLRGPLTREAAFRICQEVEIALGYYGYDEVEFLIDSPGGELAALGTLLPELARWREEHGLLLRTHVLGQAASAAGFVLACGTVGHRSASPGSRILFHQPRAEIGDGDASRHWTQGDFVRVGHLLEEASDQLLHLLASYIWRDAAEADSLVLRRPGGETVSIQSEAALRDIYEDLLQEERWLAPEDAVGLCLIDRVEAGGGVPALEMEKDRRQGRTP